MRSPSLQKVENTTLQLRTVLPSSLFHVHCSTQNLTRRRIQLADRESWLSSLSAKLARVMGHGSLHLATAPQRFPGGSLPQYPRHNGPRGPLPESRVESPSTPRRCGSESAASAAFLLAWWRCHADPFCAVNAVGSQLWLRSWRAVGFGTSL